MEEEAATEQGHSMQGFLTMKKLFKHFGAVTNQYLWIRCCGMCKSCKWFLWSYFCSRFRKSRRVIIHLHYQTKRSGGAIYFKLAFNYSLVPRQRPKIFRSPKEQIMCVCRSITSQSLLQIEFELTDYPISGPDTQPQWPECNLRGYSPYFWLVSLATFHCGMEYEKKTIFLCVPHHFSPHFFTPSLPHPHSLTTPPLFPSPHCYSLPLSLSHSLILSYPHPITPSSSCCFQSHGWRWVSKGWRVLWGTATARRRWNSSSLLPFLTRNSPTVTSREHSPLPHTHKHT